MTALPDHQIFKFAQWHTVSVAGTEDGYAVFEKPDRFWRERMAERVLRLVGVGLILAGYAQWFLPAVLLQGNPVVAHVALTCLFMGTGMGLYFFASRGFRKELHFEMSERQISVCRLNAGDRCLISRQIPMDRIESLFVERATAQSPLASLNIRMKGRSRTARVMRGAQSEMEELHAQLSRDIQVVLSFAAAPSPAPRARVAKPVKAVVERPTSLFRRKRPQNPMMALDVCIVSR